MSRTTEKIPKTHDERELRTEQRRRREEGRRTIHLHPEPMGDTAATRTPTRPTVSDGATPPADGCPPVFWWVHRSLTRTAPTHGEYVLMAANTDPHSDWAGQDMRLHSRYGDARRFTAREWGQAVVDGLIMQEPIRTYRQRAVAVAMLSGSLTPPSAVEELFALHAQDDARAAGVGR